jgi:hypothetical protein
LNDYSPEAYAALEAQHDWTYTNNPGQTVGWDQEFGQLFAAMNAWASHDVSSNLLNIQSSLYQYFLVAVQFGYTEDYTDLEYIRLFSMNDMLGPTGVIASRPVDYYNDMIHSVFWNSPKIDADTNTINAYATLEASRINALFATVRQLGNSHINNVLFGDPIPEVVATTDRMAIRQSIFNTPLNYKKVYTNLNVGGLVLPGGV